PAARARSACVSPASMRAARIWRPETMLLISRIYIRVWNVTVLYQLIDTASRPWPTWRVGPAVGIFPVEQRVARSLSERWPAVCRAGEVNWRFKAINSRTGEGQPNRCPFQWRKDPAPPMGKAAGALRW